MPSSVGLSWYGNTRKSAVDWAEAVVPKLAAMATATSESEVRSFKLFSKEEVTEDASVT
jgi:hypothetical protein